MAAVIEVGDVLLNKRRLVASTITSYSKSDEGVVWTRSKKKTKDDSWKNSEAKRLLYKDLLSGDIPLDAEQMGPQVVFYQRVEFTEFKHTNFCTNLRNMRANIIASKKRATFDSDALAHDRRAFPKKSHNHRGVPRWEGSEAEELLKIDVGEKKHLQFEPHDLHKTQNEHKKFPYQLFRKHVHQEVRTQKFLAQLRARNLPAAL